MDPPPHIYVKGQEHTEVMNVQNMLSYGDTPMCQIWYANVKVKKKSGSDFNLQRQMDGQTE